jgi:hypothetical protein
MLSKVIEFSLNEYKYKYEYVINNDTLVEMPKS